MHIKATWICVCVINVGTILITNMSGMWVSELLLTNVQQRKAFLEPHLLEKVETVQRNLNLCLKELRHSWGESSFL